MVFSVKLRYVYAEYLNSKIEVIEQKINNKVSDEIKDNNKIKDNNNIKGNNIKDNIILTEKISNS